MIGLGTKIHTGNGVGLDLVLKSVLVLQLMSKLVLVLGLELVKEIILIPILALKSQSLTFEHGTKIRKIHNESKMK